MAESDKSGKQHREQDTSGGNIVGKGPTNHTLHQPPNFLGESGKPSPNSHERGKGGV